MEKQRNEFSFSGQKIYVGIDVHLKSWSVSVLSATSVLKKFSQNPDPESLHGFLTRSYPDAEYHSVVHLYIVKQFDKFESQAWSKTDHSLAIESRNTRFVPMLYI